MPWSANEVFWYALGSGVAVSMIGFLAAFLLIGFKLFSTMETFSVVIQVLFALSCGALLGEVLLHLLP